MADIEAEGGPAQTSGDADAAIYTSEVGLPPWWLNEQATAYLPTRIDTDAVTVLERPGLTVTAASAHHLLAMKVRAARQRDIADIVALARLAGVSSAYQVTSITEQTSMTRRSTSEVRPRSPTWTSLDIAVLRGWCVTSGPPVLVEVFVVARTCEELQRRGWETTAVLATSDHGDDIVACGGGPA